MGQMIRVKVQIVLSNPQEKVKKKKKKKKKKTYKIAEKAGELKEMSQSDLIRSVFNNALLKEGKDCEQEKLV